jgi:hypothetical protein
MSLEFWQIVQKVGLGIFIISLLGGLVYFDLAPCGFLAVLGLGVFFYANNKIITICEELEDEQIKKINNQKTDWR